MNNDDFTRNINLNQGNYFEYIENFYQQDIFIQIDTLPKPTGFPQNIPRSSTDKFVGRQKELIRLSQQLQEEDQVTIAHIEGMGGIGKTELAIAYSLTNLQCNTYPGGICWLFCRDQDIGLQIVNFARNYLGLNPPEDSELLDQVTWCWQRWQKGNTLIVLDDVTDYENIETYLPPQSSQFKVLITTRLKLELANPLYLKVLSESESLELLSDLIGSEKVNLELATAKELCQRLGYLPLALQLVGRYVKKRRISLSEELRRLEAKGLAHLSTPIVEKKTKVSKVIKRGVAAAFELSWEELTEPAQELGCLLSLFALAPIPWSLVESAAVEKDIEDLEDARVKLEDLHLLQFEEVEDSYQLHQLIQEFFRDKQNKLADSEQQKRNFCTAIAEIADQIPEALTLEDVTHFNLFIPHLAETANLYQKCLSDKELIIPFIGLGLFYEGQGLYEQACPWYEKSLSVARKYFGESHVDVAISLNNLARLRHHQGIYEQAEPLFLQALELSKQILEEENLHVLLSIINNLAAFCDDKGIYEPAESFYLKALEISKQILGESHPDVATSMNNLAVLYHNQGRYSEAESLHLKALEISKQILGESHPDVAINMNNLAALYYNQGRYDKAERFYLKVLELKKQLLGESHPSIATSIHNLAELYNAQGRYSKAESFYLKALEISKQILGESHPDVATSMNNLAALYYNQGRYDKAEPLYLQSLELRKQILGELHPNVATSMNNLALLYDNQGKYEKAEHFHLQALELLQKILGEEHPDLASSMNNLALLYNNQGKYEKAEPLYLKSLELKKQLLGESHPNVANSMNNLAVLYYNQGRYQEAKTLFQQALNIFESTLGVDHPNTNIIKSGLQYLLNQMNNQ